MEQVVDPDHWEWEWCAPKKPCDGPNNVRASWYDRWQQEAVYVSFDADAPGFGQYQVRPEGSKGQGLFSLNDVPAGEVVCVFPDPVAIARVKYDSAQLVEFLGMHADWPTPSIHRSARRTRAVRFAGTVRPIGLRFLSVSVGKTRLIDNSMLVTKC